MNSDSNHPPVFLELLEFRHIFPSLWFAPNFPRHILVSILLIGSVVHIHDSCKMQTLCWHIPRKSKALPIHCKLTTCASVFQQRSSHPPLRWRNKYKKLMKLSWPFCARQHKSKCTTFDWTAVIDHLFLCVSACHSLSEFYRLTGAITYRKWKAKEKRKLKEIYVRRIDVTHWCRNSQK